MYKIKDVIVDYFCDCVGDCFNIDICVFDLCIYVYFGKSSV